MHLGNYAIAFSIIVFFAGCLPIPDQSKINKLQDANQSHQEILKEELDSTLEEKAVEASKSEKPLKDDSQIRMEVGDTEPGWANKLPTVCGKKLIIIKK